MKTRLIPLLTLGLLFCSSCEKDDPPAPEAKNIIHQYKSAELVDSGQDFSFELFREVCALSSEDNLMISPLSVSYALGMAYNGARGLTLEAFETVLHLEGLSREDVNRSYQSLMSQMLDLDPKVDFSIANSMWYRLGFEVVQDFIDNNRTYFDAEVAEVDFSDPQTLEKINGWIEEKTRDKIQDMLDYIPPDAVMYLINALYFNAPWKYEFDKADTYKGNFRLEDGSMHPCDFMKVEGTFNLATTEAYSSLELPYGDSAFSMVLVKPKYGSSPEQVLESLDAGSWAQGQSNAMMQQVQVHLPKFKHEFKMLLNDPLKNLGLGPAFSMNADFSGITPPGGIYISRVIHQTFIDVMEKGNEAAAATIIEFRETSAGGPGFFMLDQPFLYLIKENSTGAILFMGKVGKPEYE